LGQSAHYDPPPEKVTTLLFPAKFLYAILPMIPSIFELHDVLFNTDACKRYLLEKDVFYHTLSCPACGQEMTRNIDRWKFRCPSKACHRELSMFKHTFFAESRLSSDAIMLLAHLWLNGTTSKVAQSITKFSKHTVAAYYKHFRDLVSSSLEEDAQVIGGPGVIVEVDETKLGKRKYNRGHRVDGVWIVAGVERTVERKVFLVAVEDRNARTLLDVIQRHVASGSVVHTDLWRGYFSITAETGLEHRTVNHSKHYKDPETGVHTNFIEGTNCAIKRKIPIRSRVRGGIEEHLMEFVWRRANANNLWESFIKALKDIHYDLQ
jgi:hypothetical protein